MNKEMLEKRANHIRQNIIRMSMKPNQVILVAPYLRQIS